MQPPNSLDVILGRTLVRIKAYLIELEVDCEQLRASIDDPGISTSARLETRRMLSLLMTARINLNKLITAITAPSSEVVPPNTPLH